MSTSLSETRLGFLGAGNMAEALVRGVLKAGLIPADKIIASDLSEDRRAFFESDLKIKTTSENQVVLENANVIFLCVKPQQAPNVLEAIKSSFVPDKHLLASIAAGVPSTRLENALPDHARVVRVMPNTPMLVGLGASCICKGSQATDNDLDTVEAILASASSVLRVAEPMMDAVTGLSGSGPAYLFYLVEAMVDAGVTEGFSKADALKLAIRTCLGAARMLEETGLDPETLRQRVTSPNGTTQAAIEHLDKHNVKSLISDAVKTAAARSRELGKQ